ncbi:MAG: GNAT family N-acetyltransferase [Butyricimonas faecihominis]
MKEKRNRVEIVERCVELWEASVRATHDFLVEEDIEFYRPFVRENCEKLPLLLHYEGDEIVAFLGYDMTSIEMLFVDPDYRGQGIGRDLIEWAIEDIHAERGRTSKTSRPWAFMRMGFEVERRTKRTVAGKHPILTCRTKNRSEW